jgi:hypothetical protein
MIKFALRCERGHAFESWFPDGASYEAQARRGLVQCPDCDSRRVAKAPMAPAVHGGHRAERADPGATAPVALIDEKQREFRAAMVAMRKRIEAHTEDVGGKFPDLARAIHIGDEPERAIRGVATLAEAKALIEEGVGVMPLPFAPEEAN